MNANPVSAALAETAAREVLDALPRSLDDLRNEALRTRSRAPALSAGLAFSNTRTALAHALSYHLTLHFGVPHGIACSFSLPMVMRSVIGLRPGCDARSAASLATTLPPAPRGSRPVLTDARRLAARHRPRHRAADWSRLIDDALAGERGTNFIGRRETLITAA